MAPIEPLHKMALRKLLCSRLDSPPCAKSNIYHSSFQTQASFSTKDIVQRSTKQENLVIKRLRNARVDMCHCNAVLVYTHSTYAIIFQLSDHFFVFCSRLSVPSESKVHSTLSFFVSTEVKKKSQETKEWRVNLSKQKLNIYFYCLNLVNFRERQIDQTKPVNINQSAVALYCHAWIHDYFYIRAMCQVIKARGTFRCKRVA